MRKLTLLGASALGVSLLGATFLMAPTGSVDHPASVASTTTDERGDHEANLGFDTLGYGLVLSENKYWESHGMN